VRFWILVFWNSTNAENHPNLTQFQLDPWPQATALSRIGALLHFSLVLEPLM
jgi:hypothetical protein